MRRAHERPHALVVGGVEDIDHGADLLEAQRLSARLLLGHVVHAEELVVAKEQSIHQVLQVSVAKDGVVLEPLR